MTSPTAERKVWPRPHPYKANYVWFISIVIFRQYIIVPEHLMLCAALNACLSIQCRFRHLMPYCIGINKNSTENYRIMPILAYNASNGFKCQNRHYNTRINGRFTQDFPFNEHHRNSLTNN